MHKLLIITHSYPPSNAPASQRSFFFAKYLQETSDIGTVVVTPEHPITNAGTSTWADIHNSSAEVQLTGYLPIASAFAGSRQPQPPVNPKTKKNQRGRRRWNLRGLSKIFARKVLLPDRGILWYPHAVRAALRAIKNDPTIKAILSSSPSFSDHIVARKVALKTGLPWIADFRDFHYVASKELSERGLSHSLHRKLEEKVVRDATECTFISDSMKEIYETKYPKLRGRATSIYNGYDPFESSPPTPVSGLPFRIFYAGSFYEGVRSPRPLLTTLDRLIVSGQLQASDVQILVAGDPDTHTLDTFAEYQSGRSVSWLGTIERRVVLQQMSQADALWLIVGDLKNHYHSFPVKGYEFMGAKRPILAFCPEESEAAKILDTVEIAARFPNDISGLNAENLLAYLKRAVHQKSQCVSEPVPPEPPLRFTRRQQAFELGKILHRHITPSRKTSDEARV